MISELGLEVDGGTLAGTSAVRVCLSTFTTEGNTCRPDGRVEIHGVPGSTGDALRAQETRKFTSDDPRPPVRGVCI